MKGFSIPAARLGGLVMDAGRLIKAREEVASLRDQLEVADARIHLLTHEIADLKEELDLAEALNERLRGAA